MSPGATFARVYNELKRMLAEGELPPGTPIEPALIGKQIASSITPVRDALHRLTGERLVEAPNHNGFRVPLMTEASLRDLYQWRGQLVGLAVRRSPFMGGDTGPCSPDRLEYVPEAIATAFLAIAMASKSHEHGCAVGQLNDRLAPISRVEPLLLDGLVEEHALFIRLWESRDRSRLASAIERYHRRRVDRVPDLIAALTRPKKS